MNESKTKSSDKIAKDRKRIKIIIPYMKPHERCEKKLSFSKNGFIYKVGNCFTVMY